MGTSYRPYQPDQPYLLPPSLREWLPEDHLAYFISDTIDALDLRVLYERYEGDGRRNRPYHPAMLLKVLVYCYATGVFSSRRIAAKLVEDVALRVLAAGNRPDFRTINRFRQQHLETFGELFVEVVRLARRMGLVKLGTVALDGTKVRANASKHKAMSYERMQAEERRLEQEVRALLERAQQIDLAEDELYGAEHRGDELPEELRRREQRLAKIREAKRALEAEQAGQDQARGRQGGLGEAVSGRGVEVPAGVWRAAPEEAAQFHRPGEPDHETAAGVRAVLQRASGGGRRPSVDRGAAGGPERGRQRGAAGAGR